MAKKAAKKPVQKMEPKSVTALNLGLVRKAEIITKGTEDNPRQYLHLHFDPGHIEKLDGAKHDIEAILKKVGEQV